MSLKAYLVVLAFASTCYFASIHSSPVENFLEKALHCLEDEVKCGMEHLMPHQEPHNAPRDPDIDRDAVEMIESRGFKAEEYQVHTADGYILKIQRLINPLVKPELRSSLKPVILQHGLLHCSVDWVINSPHVRPSDPFQASPHPVSDNQSLADDQEHPNSLGYYLANRKYDVWLTNTRGNVYGQQHEVLSSKDDLFWDFTFDEHIKFDLTATIEFIQKHTNKTKLGYVGHSQGTTMMFGLLSEKPEYADIIEPVVALAPVAFVNNAKSKLKSMSLITQFIEDRNKPFMTRHHEEPKYHSILQAIVDKVENSFGHLMFGPESGELDLSRNAAYRAHQPSGTSVKNIAHWGQMINSGRFAKFQHKEDRSESPSYRLEDIRSKSIVMFASDDDYLASPKDVQRLREALKVDVMEFHDMTPFNLLWSHADFVYSKRAGELINTRIEEALIAVES